MAKVCLTTYIYGIQYQSYIPILLYTFEKSYPEYDVILFLYDKLDPKVKSNIEMLNLTLNYKLVEEHYGHCNSMTPLKSKSLRWVLWDETFTDYDYIYVVDIDMLYIKEPVALHKQHIEHMKVIDLPFSNIKREFVYKNHDPKTIAVRLKHAGIRKILTFLTKNPVEYKISGLHFISTKEYYKSFTHEIRNKFESDILSGAFLNYIMYPNNEILLYYMMSYIGFDTSRLGYVSNELKSTTWSFDLYSTINFRSTHGIHLGNFRNDEMVEYNNVSLNSPTYAYYMDYFINEFYEDYLFVELLKDSPQNIKDSFSRLFRYYNLPDKTK